MTNTQNRNLSPQSIEFQILACCCRLTLTELASARLTQLLQKTVDWDYLFELSVRHGIGPLLYRHLRSIKSFNVESSTFRKLSMMHRQHLAHTMLLENQQKIILHLLDTNGIQVIPYKGVALGSLLYGDAALRPSSDIDLIVRQNEIQSTISLLRNECGYSSDFVFHSPEQEAHYIRNLHHYGLSHPQRPRIEVHWTVVPPSHGFRIDWKRLWLDCTSSSWQNESILLPQPEDLLLLLVIHGCKHRWETLKWLVDIGILVNQNPEMQWDVVWRRARMWRAERALEMTLATLDQILDIRTNEQFVPEQAPSVSWLVNNVCEHLTATEGLVEVDMSSLEFNIRLQDHMSDRIRYVARLGRTANFRDVADPSLGLGSAHVRRFQRILGTRSLRESVKLLAQVSRKFLSILWPN